MPDKISEENVEEVVQDVNKVETREYYNPAARNFPGGKVVSSVKGTVVAYVSGETGCAKKLAAVKTEEGLCKVICDGLKPGDKVTVRVTKV